MPPRGSQPAVAAEPAPSRERHRARVVRVGAEPLLDVAGHGLVRFAYRQVKKRPGKPRVTVSVGDEVECRIVPTQPPKAVAVRLLGHTEGGYDELLAERDPTDRSVAPHPAGAAGGGAAAEGVLLATSAGVPFPATAAHPPPPPPPPACAPCPSSPPRHTCAACSKQLSAADNFCSRCGTPVSLRVTKPPNEQPLRPGPPGSWHAGEVDAEVTSTRAPPRSGGAAERAALDGRRRPAPGAAACSKGHACIISQYSEGTYEDGWICDTCTSKGRGRRWFCPECLHDLCFICAPPSRRQLKSVVRATAPAPGELEPELDDWSTPSPPPRPSAGTELGVAPREPADGAAAHFDAAVVTPPFGGAERGGAGQPPPQQSLRWSGGVPLPTEPPVGTRFDEMPVLLTLSEFPASDASAIGCL